MTNELITISTNQDGLPSVSGRELHEFLGLDTPYTIWFPRMVEYGFKENEDFNSYKNAGWVMHTARVQRGNVGDTSAQRGETISIYIPDEMPSFQIN